MSGFLSFLFLLVVIWLLLHCIHAFLRLAGESFLPRRDDARARISAKTGGARPCPNPGCRKDNRGDARYCAQCGQPLARRPSPVTGRA